MTSTGYEKDIDRGWYNSVKESRNYPSNFVEKPGGTRAVKVNNPKRMAELRTRESGKWQKIYKDGWVNGEDASIHYYRSQSGHVTRVELIKGRISN